RTREARMNLPRRVRASGNGQRRTRTQASLTTVSSLVQSEPISPHSRIAACISRAKDECSTGSVVSHGVAAATT
ncbi:hypothetical protein PMAYCL1PPCAC_11498, partial [Pristionchus mayeri]